MESNFYQFQLGLLAVVCVILLVYERYLKSKKTPPDNFKDPLIEENLEVGHSVLQTNGAAAPTTTPRAGSLNTLMRKYLLVYAIVMGQYTQRTNIFGCSSLAKAPIGSRAPTSTPYIASNTTSPNG
jgi:hypothetical protein